ncbi:MAG: ribonuclease HII, partial [Candidatus Omnitrophota bacterium]|nr:ribonuclease HII [Candidatus Omnitrophota bacterium]
IIAKVTRDRMMLKYDKKYPKYGFSRHKGYGTKSHLAAIEKYGPCPIHRKSFAPMKNMD